MLRDRPRQLDQAPWIGEKTHHAVAHAWRAVWIYDKLNPSPETLDDLCAEVSGKRSIELDWRVRQSWRLVLTAARRHVVDDRTRDLEALEIHDLSSSMLTGASSAA